MRSFGSFMKAISLIASSALLASILSVSSANATKCEWPDMHILDKGSPISTYTFDFWNYGKKHFGDYFPVELAAIGPVTGDFNFNNLGVYYSPKEQTVKMTLIDMDDSGTASLFLDYLKFATYLRSVDKKLDFFKILENYRKGLDIQKISNSDKNIPKKIAALLTMSADDLLKTQRDYVKRKIRKDSTDLDNDFAYGAKKLSLDKKPLQKFFENIITQSGQLHLDTGFKYNESGSSINLLRLIALTRKNNEFHIYELKEMRCPGTELFQTQSNLKIRMNQVSTAFSSHEFWKVAADVQYLTFDGVDYLLRSKQVNPIEKLEIAKLSSDDLQEYANFYSYYLGSLHSNSANAKYKSKLDSNRAEIEEASKAFMKKYLKRLLNID